MYKTRNFEYEKYIHSAEWRKVAGERLNLDKRICCVCGKEATQVHHLTYDNFRNEKMDDLVSLCSYCHKKAEDIYDPSITPWAMAEAKPEGNNFMAAMRTDALTIAPMVFAFLKEVRGADFDSLMMLRQPVDAERKKYWAVLKKAVDALCRKRYAKGCVEDRRIMMLETITNHLEVICLAEIEHFVRNAVQGKLHEIVVTDYSLFGKWKAVGEELGIGSSALQKLRKDDGTSFGPSLREAVLYYCGLDAAAGIRPATGFQSLSEEDYTKLNAVADYMISVSGNGTFKGGY